MHTLLILAGYVVYFIFVMTYASQTCDVNEYLSNPDYRKHIYDQLDYPLLGGLAVTLLLVFL